MFVFVQGNEGGDPHQLQGRHTHRFKEASGFNFAFSSNIQSRLKIYFLSFFLIPMFSPRTNMCNSFNVS